MISPSCIEFPGAVYAVSGTMGDGRSVLENPEDRSRFLEDLARVAGAREWSLYAWSVLPRSFSLIVRTPAGDLSAGLRYMRTRFSRRAHALHNTAAPAPTRPFSTVVLDPDAWLLPACRCVVLEPVRSGLVPAPEGWPWSSYCATSLGPGAMGLSPATTELLACFSADPVSAAALYGEYVLAGIDQPDILAHVGERKILGSQIFVQNVIEHLLHDVRNPSAARALLFLTRPPLSELFSPGTSRERSALSARIAGAVHLGYTHEQIAEHLGVHRTTIMRYLRRMRAPSEAGDAGLSVST